MNSFLKPFEATFLSPVNAQNQLKALSFGSSLAVWCPIDD